MRVFSVHILGVCYLAIGESGCASSQRIIGISLNECLGNSRNNFFSFDGTSSSCTPCNSVGELLLAYVTMLCTFSHVIIIFEYILIHKPKHGRHI